VENGNALAPDLYADLWTAMQEAKSARSRNDLVSSLVAHARSAARAHSGDERAGALVSLGATLRGAERVTDALDIVREARALADSVEMQVMAMTCEVAILCDQGKDEEARRIGESALELLSTPYLLNALGRAWMDGFRATGLLSFKEQAEHYFKLTEAGSAAVA
jgi:hypothetical protein